MRTIACVVLAMGTLSCTLFSSPVDPTGGAPDVLIENPSFTRDVEPLFERRCSIGGCHSIATAQAGLTLLPSAAYAALVNVQARLDPRYRRVVPFRPDSSWLFVMLDSDPVLRGPFARMPLSSTPLTENQLGTIRNWIERGAVR